MRDRIDARALRRITLAVAATAIAELCVPRPAFAQCEPSVSSLVPNAAQTAAIAGFRGGPAQKTPVTCWASALSAILRHNEIYISQGALIQHATGAPNPQALTPELIAALFSGVPRMWMASAEYNPKGLTVSPSSHASNKQPAPSVLFGMLSRQRPVAAWLDSSHMVVIHKVSVKTGPPPPPSPGALPPQLPVEIVTVTFFDPETGANSTINRAEYDRRVTGWWNVLAFRNANRFFSATNPAEGRWPVIRAGRHSLMDVKRNVYGSYELAGVFELTGQLPNGRAPVLSNKRWGYADQQGAIVINLSSSVLVASPFSQNKAAVRTNSGWSFILPDGGSAFNRTYEDAGPFSWGFAAVKQKGAWSYIDHQGNVRVAGPYQEALPFDHGVGVVKLANRWRAIDDNGHPFTDATFDEARAFAFGRMPVRVGASWGYASLDGLVEIKQLQDAQPFSYGLGAAKKNDRWGYVCADGRWAIPPVYSDAQPFHYGLALVTHAATGQQRYIDNRGVTHSNYSDGSLPQVGMPKMMDMTITTSRPGASLYVIPGTAWDGKRDLPQDLLRGFYVTDIPASGLTVKVLRGFHFFLMRDATGKKALIPHNVRAPAPLFFQLTNPGSP